MSAAVGRAGRDGGERPLEDARAVVLGASGFIGRWVAGALERAGAEAIPVVRDPETAREALDMAGVAAAPEVLDLTDLEALEPWIRAARPDIVFNLAGYGVDRSERDPELARRMNAELPAHLAGILTGLEEKAALLHAGSALEYGVARRVGEDDPARPTTDYGRTKLAGTAAVSEAAGRGLRGCTARLFTVYGPGEHRGRLLPCLLDGAARGTPVDLSEGRQRRDFTYVGDVVEGFLRLARLERPPPVVNLATGRLMKVRDFAALAARELRLGEDRLRFGALPERSDDMEHEPVPIERLRAATGWSPTVSVPEGVRRTVEVLGRGERLA